MHSYRPDIDGLRAVAVLLVIAFHAFPDIVRGGYVGVDVFFVISGYLITGIILEPLRAGTFSFADFYRRRVRRLFPALITVLLASYAIGWFLLSPPALARFGKHVASSAVFVPNLTSWRESGYFDTAAELDPLRHLWSLGVEEQFYLVWPLTLYFVVRWRRSATAILFVATLASFIACVTIVRIDSPAAFYSPFTRAWELGLGGLLMAATLERKAVRARRVIERHSSLTSAAGAALIVSSSLVLTNTSTFPGWWALMPTVGAVVLIASGRQALVNRTLSLRGFVAIGLISYPLYLWHWPLISFAYVHAKGTPAAGIRVAAVAVAFALATATFLLIERPIRRWRRSSRHIYVLASFMVFLGSLGLATDLTSGFRARYPATLQAILDYASYDYATDARAKLCWLPETAPSSGYAPECFLKPATARQRGVLVWGDSHAARLYPGLRRVLGINANIGQFTRDSCPPILDYSYSRCQKSNQRILQNIRAIRPNTVVLFAVWSIYSNWSPDSESSVLLRRTLADLRKAGVAHIVVVGPAPKWITDLPTLLFENWNAQTGRRTIPERLAGKLDGTVYDADSALRAIARSEEVEYVSLLDLLCNDHGCLTHLPGSPTALITWDYGHFTTRGATFVAHRLLTVKALP